MPGPLKRRFGERTGAGLPNGQNRRVSHFQPSAFATHNPKLYFGVLPLLRACCGKASVTRLSVCADSRMH